MTRIWTSSDHHFSHANILRFTYSKEDLRLIRPGFENVLEMNEYMVEQHNKVVKPQDHVYFLGDFSISKSGVEYAKRMNGHKRLVRGNHDIFRTKWYIENGFEEIYGVRVWPNHNIIMTHIPLHPDCLSGRGWTNVHGHLHSNVVLTTEIQHFCDSWSTVKVPDKRYVSVCMEQLDDYKPKLLWE